MGPTKRTLSGELMERLRTHYGSGGLVHYGQGKWYPGEPLPRWSLNLFWRRDGDTLWNDSKLIADETKPSGATPELAGRLLRGVATRLGLDPRHGVAAHEDVSYYLSRERRLP